MPVQRLGHVNIRTPLLEETVAFFQTVLGLRRGRAATTIDQESNVWLYDEGGFAAVHVNAPGPFESPRDPGLVSRLDHVAFDCDGQDEFAGRLAAAGIPYETVHSEAGGYVQFNCYDPNGIKIELTFAP